MAPLVEHAGMEENIDDSIPCSCGVQLPTKQVVEAVIAIRCCMVRRSRQCELLLVMLNLVGAFLQFHFANSKDVELEFSD